MKLRDKVIIVTGSTTGIGRAVAEAVVEHGGRVIVHGLEEDLGRDVVTKLGDSAALHIDDLADAGAPALLAKAAVDAFGRIDGIVNNAASTARSSIDTTSIEFFDRMIATNTRAPLMLIKAALPQLAEANGSIVNIGSVNAHCGLTNLIDYSIAKAGLMAMSRNLANHLSHRGIRINHLNPGWVLTDNEYRLKIAEGMPDNWPDTLPATEIPFGRMTTPAEIASHVVFWLSDASAPITGSVYDLCQFSFLGRIPEDFHGPAET